VTHGVGAMLGVAALVLLVAGSARSGDPWRVVSFSIYGASLIALFLASTLYHAIPGVRAKRWLRRLDHAAIFVLIAGTYTPVALLALDGSWTVVMLSIVWAGAVTGIVLKMVRIDGFRVLSNGLYIVLGWIALVAFPSMIHEMQPAALTLAVVGGLLYTAGAIVFATRHPDPAPIVFGYHEVWHVFMVAAAMCHFAMNAILVSV